MSRHPHGPRFPMGALFGGALFAAAVFGWFWIAPLAAVGAGWHPLAEAGRQLAAATAPR